MSTSFIPDAPPQERADASSLPDRSAARRRGLVSGAASVFAIASAGWAVTAPAATSPSSGVVVASSVCFVLGVVLALLQGASSSDRGRRRRFVIVGLVLLAASSAASLILGWLALSAFLSGLAVVIIVMAAAPWLEEAGAPAPGASATALIAAAAGTLAGWFLPPVVGAAVLAVALALAFISPRAAVAATPVFVLPARPALRGRSGAAGVLAVLVGAFVAAWAGLVVTAILGGVAAIVGLVIVVARSVRTRASDREGAGERPSAPNTRGYRRATARFDASAELVPTAAVTARSVDDARAALEYARANGLGVAMHSTGHAASGQPDLAGQLLVRVQMPGGVSVDEPRRLVRIPAGTPWSAVVKALAPLGLAVPHGSSGHVGVVGYLTRGGLSAYGRHTGVAANSLESVEILLADGRTLVADRDHEPELFWAIRGGGGGYGIVTAVTVRAFVPGEIVTGVAAWEIDDAAAVADAWARWTADAPSSVTTSLRVMSLPPLPGMPLRLTRRPLVFVDGTAVDGDVAASEASDDLLRRLRGAAHPVLDTWSTASAVEVPHTHMDPPISPPHAAAHALLGAADWRDENLASLLVRDFVAAAAAPETGVGIAELRQLGGRLATAPTDAGAVGHFRGAFGWFAVALDGKTGRADAEARIDRVWEQVEPWASGFTVPTLAVNRDRPARSFPEDVARRSDAVRRHIDPTGLFRAEVAPGAQV